MSVASGKVTQNNLSGSQLLYTDTGSYGAIISRTLLIYDCNGVLLQTYNMGTNLTQVYPITADTFFKFVCVVIDNTGTFTAEVDYVAIGYYYAAYLARYSQTQCGCDPKAYFMDQAEDAYNAALRYNVGGNFVAANSAIIDANILINTY